MKSRCSGIPPFHSISLVNKWDFKLIFMRICEGYHGFMKILENGAEKSKIIRAYYTNETIKPLRYHYLNRLVDMFCKLTYWNIILIYNFSEIFKNETSLIMLMSNEALPWSHSIFYILYIYNKNSFCYNLIFNWCWIKILVKSS